MTTQLGTTHRLPTDNLETYPHNPRRGSVQTIADSLRTNGQFRPLVVNKGTHTGRPNEVLAGNHTLLAARHLDGTPHEITELDCYVIDVDEEHARRIVLADNRTSDLGSYDDAALAELLEAVDELDGTGYDDDDLADIMASIEEQEDLPDAYTTETPDAPSSSPAPGSGLLNNSADTDNADKYADRGTRMFVLAYPYSDYVWVSEQIEVYRKANPDSGVTNSDVLMHMLANSNDVDLPHPLGDDAGEE